MGDTCTAGQETLRGVYPESSRFFASLKMTGEGLRVTPTFVIY